MAKVQDIQLLLVRCGATSWDEGGRLAGGGTDLPLCEGGRCVVREKADRLAGSHLGIVFSGPDAASIETAKAVADVTGGKHRVAEDLGEVRLGLWEGLLVTELEERFPTAYRQWHENPEGVLVPQGESIEEARERLIAAIGRILSRSRGVSKGVALVLRPVAYHIIRAWLRGEPVAENWLQTDAVPPMEWHCVPRLKLRGGEPQPGPVTPGSRAKAS